MGDFNRNRRSFGGGGKDFKRRDSDRPQMMHKAICSNCRKDCEVPFRPSGNKPVFCRDCFQNNRTSSSMRPENNYPRRSNFEDRSNNQIGKFVEQPQCKEQLETLNTKLDKILKILTPVISVNEAPLIKKEKTVKEVKILHPEKLAVVVEKKKRLSKKTPLTPKE